MNKKSIPSSVQEQALIAVAKYNSEQETSYYIRFSGQFAYLERIDNNNMISKIGRLKYEPRKQKWNFAVFKYSTERYDPDEWMFPGVELLDGTIEGAMKAGMEIYPPTDDHKVGCNPLGCLLLLIILPFKLIVNGLRRLFGR